MPGAAFQLVGGSYQAESLNLDAQRTVNLYPSSDQSKGGRNIGALLGTPGLTLLLTLPASPIRCLWGSAERLFVVAGTALYEVFSGTCTTVGTAVTWTGGYSNFAYMWAFNSPVGAPGTKLYIGAGSSIVGSIASSTSLTLLTSVGNNTNVPFIGYNFRGNVGLDGNPAQIFANGSQILIVSAGLVYLDGGLGPNAVNYANGTGTVKTVGTAVTWLSGDKFDSSNLLGLITISGTGYTVASVNSPTSLTLNLSAGSQDTAYSGTVNTNGTLVTWVSGSTFDAALSAAVASWAQNGQTVTITINSVAYQISQVNSTTSLTLTSSAGVQSAVAFAASIGVAYSASYPVKATTGAFLDGYFIVNPPFSRQINISAYEDGSMWNPIDFGVKAGYPDNVAAILADHEELWLFGTETTEIWQDTGNANFPFQRNPGAYIPIGCSATFSPVRFAGGVAWLGGDARQRCRAFFATGFIPQPVSTTAAEKAWRSYTTIADAVSSVYSEDGHDFWKIDFPTGNATWVYDATEGMWHERAYNCTFSGGVLTTNRQLQSSHAFVFDKHIVGDWSSGNLYIQSLTAYQDNGTAITRSRAASDVSQPNLAWMFYSRFRLDAENTGALNPTLDWSVDGGHNFINQTTDAAASVGDEVYSYWEWRRLGRSRPRTFRVTISANVRVAIINGSVASRTGGG